MGNGELPNGWTWTTIKDCSTVVTGRTPSKSDSNNYGKFMPFVKPPELLNGSIYLAEDNISEKGTTEARVLPLNSVLVSCIGNLGKTGINRVPVAFNQQINAVIFPENIIPEFGFYYFQSSEFKSRLKDISSATTVAIVNKSKFESLSFPVAPVSEQKRIVAKIEELFTQLDAGTAALHRVKSEVKRYKASVLKAACEGKLLENRGVENNNGLPEGWKWSTVAELAADEPYSITDGPFGSKLKTEHYTNSGPRVIRLQNIGDGEFRDEKAHISKEHFATLKRHKVYAGDLVIAGMGVSLPRACMIPEYVGDAIVKADCIRFKPNPNIADVKYLLFALNSETVKKLVAKIVHGIGRPRLNQQEIKAIPIPLPPLEEQRRIVAEVERRLSLAAGVESTLAASLSHAARLRQSVLKSAFEGRLV